VAARLEVLSRATDPACALYANLPSTCGCIVTAATNHKLCMDHFYVTKCKRARQLASSVCRQIWYSRLQQGE
jgi:hypothetical protein